MSLNKQSTSSGAGSSGHSYEVLQSQAWKIVFRVYSFFKKYVSEDEQSGLNFLKCKDLTDDKVSDITGFGEIWRYHFSCSIGLKQSSKVCFTSLYYI
jgi:hypothetical protein